MCVPTSEVGYTSAMPRREGNEVHKGMWGHWRGIYIYIYTLDPPILVQQCNRYKSLYMHGMNHITHCEPSGVPNAQSHVVKNLMVLSLAWRWLFKSKHVTLTYTYSMMQSPSWEATWFAAGQEIPRISRNPKVHYRTHKRPPPVSILGQPNPVHIPTSHLLETRSNIIHPSTPRSPQWSPSLRFPHQEGFNLSFYYTVVLAEICIIKWTETGFTRTNAGFLSPGFAAGSW